MTAQLPKPDSKGVKIYFSTVLKYNFEGSVLYLSIIFGEYS